MSANSSIEWTDRTWNPVRGCSVISPGCHNCYAMKMAHRFSGPGRPYAGLTKLTERSGPQWTGKIDVVSNALREPLSWRKPSRIFVNSMSDLFHESVPDTFIADVFATMAKAPQHTFQILTKRPDRMREWVTNGVGWMEMAVNWAGGASGLPGRSVPWPLPNVWLGVSVENQKYADERIPHLLQTPAAIRFISAEPLLGPVDLCGIRVDAAYALTHDALRGTHNAQWGPQHGDEVRLDWVIVGGESGNGARPCHTDWIANIVEQCARAGVPCFVKQLGANGYQLPGGYPLKDRKGGDMSEWPADLRVRQFPKAAA